MNKKFTLLFAAAMLSSSLVNSMFAESLTTTLDLKNAKKDVYYALKASHLYNGTWNQEPNSYYVVAENGKFNRVVKDVKNDNEVLGNNVWKVTSSTTAAGTVYTFTSKDNKVLKVSNIEGFVLRETFAPSAGETTVYGLNLNANDYVSTTGTELVSSTTASSSGVGFVLETLSVEDVTAKELNSIQGGKGLIFAYPSEEQPTVENDILTGKQLVAIEVGANIKTSAGETIPAGVYFATNVSENLKLEKDGTLKNDPEQVKAFLASEFIAVNPSIPANTSDWKPSEGIGYSLTTVAGADLSFEATTKGSTVSVNNACFTVAEPDAYTTTNQYTLTVAKANLETEKSKNHKPLTSVKIGIRNVDGNKRLTTSANAQLFKTQATESSAIVDATTLLNTDKTPAIYAIKVLSGDAKGQYMTNGANAVPEVDVNDPANQYVIVNVDKKTNKVTFKNRIASSSFTVSFYGDAPSLTYTLVSDGDLKIKYAKSDDKDVVVGDNTNLNAETVELIKVTPKSKYDGYVNVDEEDYKLFTFNMAPYVGSSNVSNLVVEGSKLFFDKEEDATQFVLTNKNEIVKTNDFVSLEGEEVKLFTDKDTVVTPTYNVSVYDPAILVDGKEAKSLNKLGTSVTAISRDKGVFAIKEYQDGSVFLVNGATINTFIANERTGAASFAKLSTPFDYLNRKNVTIMDATESASVSLEAKSQHVSMMETVAGAYVMADSNNDAIVKGAESAAVLWLDTTKTEATIPSFYISQGGKFLYNSVDSTDAEYDVPGTRDAKLIFKNAELVASDTLKTTVNGREVFVAAKPNALQNVVSGINKFQYQILKAKEDNEYVIRQEKSYVKTINGYLTLTGNINDAMHVVITSESAPTSNENVVVASEVKVVANNGSVVVKNASGKNVVVSTILGQVVANEVLTSDNATINVPAGIVVVAVDGESFKVSVK